MLFKHNEPQIYPCWQCNGEGGKLHKGLTAMTPHGEIEREDNGSIITFDEWQDCKSCHGTGEYRKLPHFGGYQNEEKKDEQFNMEAGMSRTSWTLNQINR